MHIPENYPDGDVPKIVFENSVFHPSIHPDTHVLNVKQVTLILIIISLTLTIISLTTIIITSTTDPPRRASTSGSVT